jgi:glutathione S-transferase
MSVWYALSYQNYAFRVYITWGGFLLLKMLAMALITSIQRIRKGAIENPEDALPKTSMEVKKDDAVERVRRAHLNDLENIPVFMFAALM